jgi:hypothetical protein
LDDVELSSLSGSLPLTASVSRLLSLLAKDRLLRARVGLIKTFGCRENVYPATIASSLTLKGSSSESFSLKLAYTND